MYSNTCRSPQVGVSTPLISEIHAPVPQWMHAAEIGRINVRSTRHGIYISHHSDRGRGMRGRRDTSCYDS